jgi:integrase
MSLYKHQASAFYHFDFRIGGRRFHGSTECTDKRKAKAVEDEAKTRARAEVAAGKADPVTMDLAADRYWIEVGQHHAAPKTTMANLKRLVLYFGPARRLDDIKDQDVAALVAWRRGQTVKGRKKAKLLEPATVNRSTIEPLQKLFNRAKRAWGMKFVREPDWKVHILKEPIERVREVRPHEEEQIDAAIREEYRAVVAFARASGLRMAECLLKKEQVDLVGAAIWTTGKGDKPIRKPVTSEMRAILSVAMKNPTDYVFAYKAARNRQESPNGEGARIKGQFYPVTTSGLKTIWRRARLRKSGAALPADLRFHDTRHDFATNLLRTTGNLKLVQKALGHSKIETTTKYAHVLDDEVAAGMEAAAQARARRRKKAKTKKPKIA